MSEDAGMRQFDFPQAVRTQIHRERFAHPDVGVRQRMEILWLKACDEGHERIAQLAGVSRPTVQRVLAQAIAICALRRETWSHVEAARPEVPPADQCAVAPPRKATGFLQRYEFRLVRGKPFAENADSLSYVWVSDVPPRPLDFASLTALCDSFLPRIFLLRPDFVPIGTVSINIYFHAGEEVLARHGAAPLLAVAQAQAFSDGHFDHQGQLWGGGDNGEDTLLATTQQLVWYKE